MDPKTAQQYVISRPRAPRTVASPPAEPPVAALVDAVAEVRVLGEIDASTALVEMSEGARVHIERTHPELSVEPNLLYARGTLRRGG